MTTIGGFSKLVSDVSSYSIDWSDVLETSGLSIEATSWAVNLSGMVIERDVLRTHDTTEVVVSAGTATLTYTLTNTVTLSDASTQQRSLLILVLAAPVLVAAVTCVLHGTIVLPDGSMGTFPERRVRWWDERAGNEQYVYADENGSWFITAVAGSVLLIIEETTRRQRKVQVPSDPTQLYEWTDLPDLGDYPSPDRAPSALQWGRS